MTDYLIHYGILGQKWGVRRYQNPDGTLTDVGRKRYNTGLKRLDERDRFVNERSDEVAARLGTAHNIKAHGLYDEQVQKTRNANAAVRSSEERTTDLGIRTVRQRVATLSAGTIASGTALAALYSLSPLVAVAGSAALAGGSAYIYKLTKR